jgi:hypothetical protein
MSASLILPLISGMLLAAGQFFMKKVAVLLPGGSDLWSLVFAGLKSPYLYVFLGLNIAATITYIASLRFLSMTNTFAIVFVSMGATVLALDVIVNAVRLSTTNLLGVGLAMLAVLLIAAR